MPVDVHCCVGVVASYCFDLITVIFLCSYSYNEGVTWREYIFTNTSLRIYGLLTEPGSVNGNFSIWGSKPEAHSWVIIHLNLETIFGGKRQMIQ